MNNAGIQVRTTSCFWCFPKPPRDGRTEPSMCGSSRGAGRSNGVKPFSGVWSCASGCPAAITTRHKESSCAQQRAKRSPHSVALRALCVKPFDTKEARRTDKSGVRPTKAQTPKHTQTEKERERGGREVSGPCGRADAPNHRAVVLMATGLEVTGGCPSGAVVSGGGWRCGEAPGERWARTGMLTGFVFHECSRIHPCARPGGWMEVWYWAAFRSSQDLPVPHPRVPQVSYLSKTRPSAGARHLSPRAQNARPRRHHESTFESAEFRDAVKHAARFVTV